MWKSGKWDIFCAVLLAGLTPTVCSGWPLKYYNPSALPRVCAASMRCCRGIQSQDKTKQLQQKQQYLPDWAL